MTYQTAIFRQVNKDQPRVHHDALEFPDGRKVLVTLLTGGQRAIVLQLPVNRESADRLRSVEPHADTVS